MGANVSVERACLLVKQPVSIFPARTQLPGVRVLLIVRSVHTSGTRDPGRMGTNYVPSRSLPVPWRPRVRCPPRLPGSAGQKEPWKLVLPVSFCHIFKAMTLGFKGPGQQFSTGGVCASGGALDKDLQR